METQVPNMHDFMSKHYKNIYNQRLFDKEISHLL